MTFFPTRDFLLEVARGRVAGHTLVRRFGLNPDLDTGVEEDVWFNGGARPWYATAQALEVVSDDADDVATTGTGVRTLKLWGLNGSFASNGGETITMNGTTPVAVSTNLAFIDYAQILTTGTSESNEGTVTVRLSGAGATVAVIAPGQGVSQSATYQVPAGKTAYLIDWSSSIYKAVSGSIELRLYVYLDGIGWTVPAVQELTLSGSGVAQSLSSALMIELPAKARVRVGAKSSADNMGVSSSLTLLQV